MDNYIIGMVKPEMNGCVVPFLDLTEASSSLRPDQQPRLLDEFLVNKMEKYSCFDLPWDCRGVSIDEFIRSGQIVPGGKVNRVSRDAIDIV